MTSMPTIVATNPSSGVYNSGTANPTTGTLTAPAGGFLLNDLVVEIINGRTNVTCTAPSGWFNLLGGTTAVNSAVGSLVAVGHFITAAEVTAGTTSWTLTGLFNGSSQACSRGAAVVRGVNPNSPVGATQTAFDDTNSLIIPTITPTVSNSLTLVGCGIPAVSTSESIGTFTSPWTDLGGLYSTGTAHLVIGFGYDATANTAGTPVTGPTLSVSKADNWVAAAVELKPVPDANMGQFFALF